MQHCRISLTVRVTLVYRDTLPQRVAGWIASHIPGCQSYFGVPGYHEEGGWGYMAIPGISQ